MEVAAGLEPASLEDRLEELSRRPRICRRLQDDELALPQAGRDLRRRAPDDRKVGLALAGERRRQGDEDGIHLLQRVVVGRGGDSIGIHELLQLARGNVVDVALPAVDAVDDVLIDVDQNDRLARVGEHPRERHADVSSPDDRDVRPHPAEGYLCRSVATLRTRAGAVSSAGRAGDS